MERLGALLLDRACLARALEVMSPTFVPVPDLDALFGEPDDRYVVRRSSAYWQAERRVFGIVTWARPRRGGRRRDLRRARPERAAVEALRSGLLCTPEIVRRVHVAFEQLPARSGVSQVARRIGMSVRSLAVPPAPRHDAGRHPRAAAQA